MNRARLILFKEWFETYARRFYSPDPAEQRNIYLKIEHTARVCDIIAAISRDLSLDADDMLLAESIGLFHDIGRFPQFARYKTFRDSISVNHGRLGAEVLAEEKTLQDLPEHEQEIITTAVKFHNAYTIPDLPSDDMVLFLKLVRDADKLDIWRIFTGYFEMPEEDRASEAALGLPDGPGYSEEMIAAIYRNRSASISYLRTLNDFKLMQLSWISDLNFSASFRLLQEGDYINRLISLLPDNEEIRKVSSFLRACAAEKARLDEAG